MVMKNFKNIKIQEANRYFKEIIFQSAHLENKGITYAETINTIEFYDEAIKTIPFEKVAIINGLKRAYEYIIVRANSNNLPNEQDLLKINGFIDEYEEYANAGNYRNKPVKISGSSWVPPLLNANQAKQLVNDLSKIKSFDDGIKLCAKLSKQQLFNNGNKRTAICYANLVLLYHGYDFIQIKDRMKYMNKLVDFYEDQDKFKDLLDYIKENSIDKDEQIRKDK